MITLTRLRTVALAALALVLLFGGSVQAQEWSACWDCERCGFGLTGSIRCCRGDCRDESPCHTQEMNLSPCSVFTDPWPHCDGTACGGGSDGFKWDFDIDVNDSLIGACSGQYGCPAECASCGGDWQ